MARWSFFALASVLAAQSAHGFTQVAHPISTMSQLGMSDVTDEMRFADNEIYRKTRRTVFQHDDWVRHRSPDRFIRNLANFVSSGIYKNVGREVATATSIASFVVVYNALTHQYQDFNGESHPGPLADLLLPTLNLPMNPFTLASPSLGLLLVFRTNTSYQRWDEARKNWGSNINRTRDLVRMGTSFYDKKGVSDEKREKDLKILSDCTWAFVRSMQRHLSPEWEDEATFQQELYKKLPAEQALGIINAAHRPNRALYDLSIAIENLPMHYLRKNQMHASLTQFEDNLGSSERLLTSPVPLMYSRHLARFLSIWLFLLPFGLYNNFEGTWNHAGMIPAIGFLSLFLFGIEELAAQMEEPFTILPMQGFSDKIGNWCNEIVSWSPGDNGMAINQPYTKHYALWDDVDFNDYGVVESAWETVNQAIEAGASTEGLAEGLDIISQSNGGPGANGLSTPLEGAPIGTNGAAPINGKPVAPQAADPAALQAKIVAETAAQSDGFVAVPSPPQVGNAGYDPAIANGAGSSSPAPHMSYSASLKQ